MLKWMTELLIEHCFLQYVLNLPGIFWILIKTFSLQPMVLNNIKTTVSIFGIVWQKNIHCKNTEMTDVWSFSGS